VRIGLVGITTSSTLQKHDIQQSLEFMKRV